MPVQLGERSILNEIRKVCVNLDDNNFYKPLTFIKSVQVWRGSYDFAKVKSKKFCISVESAVTLFSCAGQAYKNR